VFEATVAMELFHLGGKNLFREEAQMVATEGEAAM
jgi:hypothetical protein